MSKRFVRGCVPETGDASGRCQRILWIILAGLTFGLAACGTPDEEASGVIGSVEGFAGAVVADEPRAVLVGRDVLSAGGTAADAAVAMYFTLAVTLPSEAGLGGGGVCVVHDPETRSTETLDFLPRPAPGGKVAVPGNARGMAALHARHGALRWEQLLAGPENLARFGTPMSRALAREVATAEALLRRDPDLAALFVGPDGQLLDEGDSLRQANLASVIGQIRQQGAGALHVGPLAASFAEGVQALGVNLTTEALRNAVPAFRETVKLPFGNHVLHAPPPPPAGGVVELQMIGMLTEAEDYEAASADERPHLLAEASKRAFADRTGWLRPDGGSAEDPAALVSDDRLQRLMESYNDDAATPIESLDPPPAARQENPWATGFVAVDRRGRAVACNVTMNGLFGVGRMVPGTGIILAAATDEPGAGAGALGPLILSNAPTGEFLYAASASGGPTAATAMVSVFLSVAALDQPLEPALATKRVHHNGAPDVVFHEENTPAEMLHALTGRGHRITPAGILGRVGAVWCPLALPAAPDSCQAAVDPRSDGLAVVLAEPQ